MIMTLQKFGGAGLSSTVSALILSTGILSLSRNDGATITNLLA